MDIQTLRRAVEASPASVVITGCDGLIQYVNPKFEQITGYTAAEAIGTNPRVLKSGLQSEQFYRDLWTTISSGHEWRGEFANRKKSGDIYWERASISPIVDERGAITHFVAVKEDVTGEHAAREQLRRSEERFDLAMRGASDGLWDWDLASGAVYYSPRWKSMLGYEDDEVEPSLAAFLRLTHPSDLARATAAADAYLQGTSRTYEVHLRMRHKRGYYVDVLSRGFAARDQAGQPCRLVGTHRDVSEQKRTEHLLAAQAAGMHVLATATGLMDTVPAFLAAVGQAGLWVVGCAWAVDPSADVLRCLSLWHAHDVPSGPWEDAVRAATLRRGEAPAGQAWSRSAPVWIEDEQLQCPAGLAGQLGLGATCAVPCLLDGRIVAVVQFSALDVRPVDHRWLRMFEQCHRVAVDIIARRRQPGSVT